MYGHYLGGVFSQDGDRVFWDVKDPAKAIVIELEGNDFSRLIIEVSDPTTTVAAINAAIACCEHQSASLARHLLLTIGTLILPSENC